MIYKRDGWAIARSPFGAEDLDPIVGALDSIFPTGDEFASDPTSHAWVTGDQFAALRWWPTGVPVLDDLVVDERLIAIAEMLLGTDDLRLMRAGYQAKYTSAADYTQVLHYDYPNHSLVVPGRDEIAGFFLYLSDISEAEGATRLVPAAEAVPVTPELTHPLPGHPLYEHESAAEGPLGSLLAYDSIIYHRGTQLTAPRARRLTLSFSYGSPTSYHGYTSWPRQGEAQPLIDFIRRASPRARSLIGFPPPGSDFWTPATISEVEKRYDVALTAYKAAARPPDT